MWGLVQILHTNSKRFLSLGNCWSREGYTCTWIVHRFDWRKSAHAIRREKRVKTAFALITSTCAVHFFISSLVWLGKRFTKRRKIARNRNRCRRSRLICATSAHKCALLHLWLNCLCTTIRKHFSFHDQYQCAHNCYLLALMRLECWLRFVAYVLRLAWDERR